MNSFNSFTLLTSGHNLLSRYVRTGQLGHQTARRPEIIDNKATYRGVLLDKLTQLAREGPDRLPTAFTP